MVENEQGIPNSIILTDEELDAIGEIMNISMGASATAVSAMLDKQVTITTPQVEQAIFSQVDVADLEPALVVKIDYVEGLQGSNIIMLRRHDMQLILSLLMGNDSADDEDFEFDDMSMSAACEVMNQMMGASSTALSEILSMTVNISTPNARLVDSAEDISTIFEGISSDEQVVNVSFKMSIKGIMDSDFSCFLPTVLTRRIISFVRGDIEEEVVEQPPMPVPVTAEVAQEPLAEAASVPNIAAEPIGSAPETQSPVAQAAQAAPQQEAPPPTPAPQQTAQQSQVPISPEQQMAQQPFAGMQGMQGMPQTPYMGQVPPGQEGYVAAGYMPYMQPQGYPPQGYPYMPQYPYMGYPPQMPAPQMHQGQGKAAEKDDSKLPPVNVKKAQFPSFSDRSSAIQPLSGPNANLLMGVPLEVSIVIGKAKRKIRDILEFGPGTVVDLDKQTGAPAEIIVNGQLLAYGDVIVIGDNFGVRITEIVGTKDLLESLDSGV